jgi:hypothetical protein
MNDTIARVDRKKVEQEQRIRDFLLKENVPEDTARKFAGELVRRVVPKPTKEPKPLSVRELFVLDIENANSLSEIYTSVVMYGSDMLKHESVARLQHETYKQIDKVYNKAKDLHRVKVRDEMSFFIYTLAYLHALAHTSKKTSQKVFPFWLQGDPVAENTIMPQVFLDSINKHATEVLLRHFIDTVFKHCVVDPANNTEEEEDYEDLVDLILEDFNINLVERGFHNNSKLPKWMQ